MAFRKGKPKTGGRTKGVPNKITAALQGALLFAYDGLGGQLALLEWARDHQTEFYKIMAKVCPSKLAYHYDREYGEWREANRIIQQVKTTLRRR